MTKKEKKERLALEFLKLMAGQGSIEIEYGDKPKMVDGAFAPQEVPSLRLILSAILTDADMESFSPILKEAGFFND